MSHKLTLTKKIENFLSSDTFKNKLSYIQKHYFNLKQETLIRDAILEHLNGCFEKDKEFKAIAEYRLNKKRVDLAIIKKLDDGEETQKPLLTVELKFQFSGDFKKFKGYRHVIEKDFETRKSDVFLLIISNWNEEDRLEYDKPWGSEDKLSKFLTKKEEWKQNIKEVMGTFENGELSIPDSILVEEPYKTEYHFYLLKRKESVLA